MSLGSLMRSVREPLALAGLAIVQAPAIEVGQGGNRVSVTTRIIHRSGQWIEASVSIAISANAAAQVVGSAITYARRYGLTALLGIASGDDDDGAQAQSSPPAYEQAPPRDLTIGKAKNKVLEAMDGDLENTRLFWAEMNGTAPGPFSPDGIAAQVALIHAVHALNPKTVVVLQGGSAIVVAPWQQDAAALLMAWYPGQEGGHAIADVLLGTTNPSGHLPLSLVQDESQLPAFINDANAVTYDYWHGYRWLDRQKLEPSYPFGFGLSYSTFTLDPDVAVTKVGDEIHVKATVHNTSQRDGLTALQLYVSYPQGPVERPVRDLQAIQKVAVAAGATAKVEWVIPVANLAYWDVASHGWRIAPGTYGLHMGFSSRDLPVAAEWKL